MSQMHPGIQVQFEASLLIVCFLYVPCCELERGRRAREVRKGGKEVGGKETEGRRGREGGRYARSADVGPCAGV